MGDRQWDRGKERKKKGRVRSRPQTGLMTRVFHMSSSRRRAEQWDPWESKVQQAFLQPGHITVPFKATQHLFPPIKTNNLFCRKSQPLLSAGAEAMLDGL
ncbi:unnamed protein product [Arctogadus glacialis]